MKRIDSITGSQLFTDISFVSNFIYGKAFVKYKHKNVSVIDPTVYEFYLYFGKCPQSTNIIALPPFTKMQV